MIPAAFITDWGNTARWPTVDQIEQDLVLSRLIIEIANDDYLGNELMFRGGTCLHKLHLNPALRYGEDLDYVRRSEGGIGVPLDAVRVIADRLGMSVTTNIKSFPKVRLRAPVHVGERDDERQGRCQHVRTLASARTHSGPVQGRQPVVPRHR